MMFTDWSNRQRPALIECVLEEYRPLEERLSHQRIRFAEAERPRVARKEFVGILDAFK
jgi:hypothetical protein